MGLSSAERQARFRAHRAGRHDLCPPDRECRSGRPQRRGRASPALDEAPSPGRGAPLPHGAGPREGMAGGLARELWDELSPLLGIAHRVVLLEACRLADRLDRLDAIVDGNDEWLRISTDEGGEIVVAVDAALAEARQGATALRGMVADLVKALPKTPAGRGAQPKGGGLADLSARIAARRSAASG